MFTKCCLLRVDKFNEVSYTYLNIYLRTKIIKFSFSTIIKTPCFITKINKQKKNPGQASYKSQQLSRREESGRENEKENPHKQLPSLKKKSMLFELSQHGGQPWQQHYKQHGREGGSEKE